MIKEIRFRDKNIKYDTETQDGFHEILNFFDRKIDTLVTGWVKNIPDHDLDDLAQVCKIKLVEGLEKYDDQANINFSTYIYTIWKRKLSQLSYKYKTKKHSKYIENDNYISFNYAFDKGTDSFYLMLGKHKCPLSKKIIDKNLCTKCEFHNGYVEKQVSKGNLKGQTKSFTKCKYFKNVLDQRGASTVSMNKKIASHDGNGGIPTTLEGIIPDKKSKIREQEADLKLDLNTLKNKLDDTTFIVLQLLVEGYNKSDIIKELDINSNTLNSCFKKLQNNKILKNILNYKDKEQDTK